MNKPFSSLIAAAMLLAIVCPAGAQAEEKERREPPVVEPGGKGNFVQPPEDAVQLFVRPGDREKWTKMNGDPIEWINVGAGNVLQCESGAGSIVTTETFRDAQIHVEFKTPYMPLSRGQGRGNSGVYLQNTYEIQVLDSYARSTYFDGQCGAVYRQKPPDVNACRPPGQWQSYDIIFRSARFDKAGARTEQARITVLHNGVLIHNNFELAGPTGSGAPESAEGGPLQLQDHGNKVRYRNIWLRHLNLE